MRIRQSVFPSSPHQPDDLWRAVMHGDAAPFDVVDIHAHLGYYRNFFYPDAEADGVIKVMDRVGIKTAVVSHLLAISADVRAGNDRVKAATEKYPGRFLGYAVVNPHYREEALPEIDRCLASRHFVGIKLHPDVQEYSITDAACQTILACAAERRLLVLSHTWQDPTFLRRQAEKYPSATLIVAHGLAVFRMDPDYGRVARECPNVYLDLAHSTNLAGTVEEIVQAAGADKLLWGSDMPFLNGPAQFAKLAIARLPEDVKTRIFGANARRLLTTE